MNKTAAVNLILQSKERILAFLRQVILDNDFNYKTFGTAIEDYMEDILVEIFKENKFINSRNDYHRAEDKNEFPDFILKTTPNLILEFKSGNQCKKSNGKWGACRNSNNDMGTLNMWAQKLEQFGGDNIYYIFIIYNFNDNVEEISDIQIAPFYKFIGINRDGMLKYREKDGNLRPKDFTAASPIKNLKQFKVLLNETMVYRSKRIIKKHLENAPAEERSSFIESLKSS